MVRRDQHSLHYLNPGNGKLFPAFFCHAFFLQFVCFVRVHTLHHSVILYFSFDAIRITAVATLASPPISTFLASFPPWTSPRGKWRLFLYADDPCSGRRLST
jgi:hypothetical protein